MKKITLLIGFLLLGTMGVYAQTTVPNNSPTSGAHLGWDDTGNAQLRITQNNTNRMLFNSLPVYNGLNGDTGTYVNRITLPQIGISNENMLAWSILHLWEGGLTSSMYRNWFNVGTSYTGNGDFMYTGLLHRPVMESTGYATDAVLAWGCQDSLGTNVDNFRIMFIEPVTTSPTEASETSQGLEVLRISPIGNVGIGDFSAMTWGLNNEFGGLNEPPTQKLDVVGTARLRQMPDSLPDVIITGVRPDTLDSLGNDFILNYIDIDSLLDCRWKTTDYGIATGYVSTDLCNEKNVGIGNVAGVNQKLFVLYEPGASTLEKTGIGTKVISPINQGQRVGVYGSVRLGRIVYGGKFESVANGANFSNTNSVGVYGYGRSARTAFGVYGIAYAGSLGYGVYGENLGSGGYGGYFVGGLSITGPSVSISDQTFKENILDMQDATAIIQNIHPKTYNFKTEEYDYMGLTEGTHCGVIAQEIQEVFPSAVYPSVFPAKYDSLGNIVQEEIEYLGVDYTELIPLLIQATKEQQAEIEAKGERITNLEAQMEELYAMMAQCCEMQGKSMQTGQEQNDIQIDKNLLKQNTPNPFDLNTSIEYYLAQGGKVTIKITNAQGQLVQVLVNQSQDQGAHQVQWNAKNIERGVYYYSLNINGEELIKRMVKL